MSNLHLQASRENFKFRQLDKIRCCIELELNMVYSFWSRALTDMNLRLTNVSFFEKLKKIDKKEFIGDICTEFQLSISTNFRFNWVVNFDKNVL